MKKNRVICILLVVLFFLVASGSGGCNPGKGDTLKIGAIVFQTGGAAEYGVWVKNGLEMAKEEINSKGGINGKNIELIYEDDKTDAQTAVTVMNRLINTVNPPVIIAGLTSKSTLAIAPIAESKKVVLFSPCSSTPDLTNSGDYIFRNWPSDNEEGRLMAEYVRNNLGYKKIVTLAMNNDYGLGLKKVFTNRFIELGGEVTPVGDFPENTNDFKPILAKLKDEKFDAIYLPSHAKEAGTLKQMKENNLSFKVLGCVTYESPDLLQLAGGAAEGVIFTTPAFNPDSADQTIRDFSTAYEKKYGKKPENFAAQSYDALKILALAIEKGGYNAEGIKNALYSIKDYQGVSGLTTFDKNGDVQKPAVIKEVSDNTFKTIGSAK